MTPNKIIEEFTGWKLVDIENDPEDPCFVFKNEKTKQIYTGEDMEILSSSSEMNFDNDWNKFMDALKYASELMHHVDKLSNKFLVGLFQNIQTYVLLSQLENAVTAYSIFAQEYEKYKRTNKS